jgi:hypothetical protein
VRAALSRGLRVSIGAELAESSFEGDLPLPAVPVAGAAAIDVKAPTNP